IWINCFYEKHPHYSYDKIKKGLWTVTQRKIPRDLFLNAQKAEKYLFRYEAIERYVINCILEAGRSDVALDDVFIKAAYKALQRSSVLHHSVQAA
ncbi:MAG: hypothetical protein KAI77_00180, partial [Gammaproteobacteria bacterium]|nr:hypothetical protein [Gammaproteobacteria bacterium]